MSTLRSETKVARGKCFARESRESAFERPVAEITEGARRAGGGGVFAVRGRSGFWHEKRRRESGPLSTLNLILRIPTRLIDHQWKSGGRHSFQVGEDRPFAARSLFPLRNNWRSSRARCDRQEGSAGGSVDRAAFQGFMAFEVAGAWLWETVFASARRSEAMCSDWI